MSKTTNGQELSEQEIFTLISAINSNDVTDVQIAGFQVPVILAGGIIKENIAQIFRAAEPEMIDVMSGVEEAPGRKDRARMEWIVSQCR